MDEKQLMEEGIYNVFGTSGAGLSSLDVLYAWETKRECLQIQLLYQHRLETFQIDWEMEADIFLASTRAYAQHLL